MLGVVVIAVFANLDRWTLDERFEEDDAFLSLDRMDPHGLGGTEGEHPRSSRELRPIECFGPGETAAYDTPADRRLEPTGSAIAPAVPCRSPDGSRHQARRSGP
jgi:hypothetical protein